MKSVTRSFPSREFRIRHRLTRLGFHIAFVGVFAMLGGAMRGINLLLVLAAMMVGLLFMQWRLCRRSIESVSLQRRAPSESFAGQPMRVRFRLTNHSWLLPVWMLRIDDPIRSFRGGDRTNASTGVGVLEAGRTVTVHYDCVISRRGRYGFGPSAVWTSFPFSLTTARKTCADEASFDVYPRLIELKRGWQQPLLGRTEGATAAAHRGGANEGEFFALRQWQSGDNLRWIHWRTTARRDEPMVRQFEQHHRFDLCLLVDAFCLGKTHDPWDADPVESAISLAATLVTRLVSSPANRLMLAVAAQQAELIKGGSPGAKRQMLGLLAGLTASPSPNLAASAQHVVSRVGHAQDLVVISSRSKQAAADCGEVALSAALQPWVRSGRFRWIDVTDPGVQRWLSPSAVAAVPRE